MSSKDKESKTFEKLKQFFRINKGGAGQLKGRVDFALTHDIEKDIGPESPLNYRMKIVKDLSEAVLNNRLEDNSIEKLWHCLKDLLQPEVAKENRHAVFAFFKCLVQGQYEKLSLMRKHFFRIITNEQLPEDVGPRLDLLVSLTENGKDILYFEEQIGPFMLQWMPSVVLAGKSYEFLSMLVNVIKYNAALIDEDVIKGLVENTCWLSSHCDMKTLLMCLEVLDTIVCYTNLPPESLQVFVVALCRAVSYEQCVQSSWKKMRNLLGTHMGRNALYTMCRLLQAPAYLDDAKLLRGAVFFINMGLWGQYRVTSLAFTPTSILPSLLRALESNERIVVYEVLLSVHRLVQKHGLELQDSAWDLILSILEAVIIYAESKEVPKSIISTHLHDTLTAVEQLVENGQFNGNADRLFALTESCSLQRPEASVLRLMSHLAAEIVPTRWQWLDRLNCLLENYLRNDSRTVVRVKAMDILSHVIQTYRGIYEDELMERIIVPHFHHMDQDNDLVVRSTAAQLLVDLCLDCDTKRCLELMDILHKIINRLYDETSGSTIVTTDAEVLEVKTAMIGLVKIFTTKLYQLPSTHCIKSYELLVGHLEAHYARPQVFEFTSSIRYMIFECFLHIRANSLGHLGYRGNSGLTFSPYLAIKGGGNSTPPPMSPVPPSVHPPTISYLSMSKACRVFITCLHQEKDWKVLQLILTELPSVMHNKALILSRHGNDMDLLASALCAMITDKTLCLPDTLRNTPLRFTRTEFHALVFPCLASLASYHAYLEPNLQQRLIVCLEAGLTSRQCSRQCVTALTTCILEMRDAMYKLLPEVLLKLTKISATNHMAIAILEFLSTLTRLPKVFASFVGDQYMSVFAMSLPYTNPFKYNHYTVSLAHHVIAVWFLKCRLPFRRDFVKFITTGLRSNVLVPFEEGQLMKNELINEDSSNRKRASSLTEQGSRRQVRPPLPVAANPRLVEETRSTAGDMKPKVDDALLNFHVELTETCIDLMARYTFNTCSALPHRHPTAEFLLNGGQTMTWLLGNKLITVTTSGCSQKALKNGLCDKCWLLCKGDKVAEPAVSPKNLSKQLTIDVDLGSQPASDINQLEPSRLDQLLFGSTEKDERNHCSCWCQGWAEIYVRRPTGDMSWIMRVQNPSNFQQSPQDFPLEDISSLFLPSLSAQEDEPPSLAPLLTTSVPIPIPGSQEEVPEEEGEGEEEDEEEGGKSRNPVRRSNSSPEMSANWKNPFLKEKKESGDARVSCEAIPEEMTSTQTPAHIEAAFKGRPPQSPKSNVNVEQRLLDPAGLSPLSFKRDRGHTISVMSPVRKPRIDWNQMRRNKEQGGQRSGINPSYVFLQLYHNAHFHSNSEKPLLLAQGDVVQRSIKILDHIPPYETHKVGVLYVGPGQASNETEILRNQFGSLRYAEFLQRLGTLIKLKDADPQNTFLGGLHKDGNDGKFAYIWQDDVMQVTFHVATLMPTKESDPLCNGKKLHIGNDYVTIVYNESGETYNIQTFKGQFNYACVIIQPLDHSTNQVVVKTREELFDHVEHSEPKIVSDQNLATLSRQLALHANLASMVSRSLKAQGQDPYASNWLERLRKIKRLRSKVLQEPTGGAAEGSAGETSSARRVHVDDFTEYT